MTDAKPCTRRGPTRTCRTAASAIPVAAGLGLLCLSVPLTAQQSSPASMAEQVRDLREAVSRTEAELANSQQQLLAMKRQLDLLQQQMAAQADGAKKADAGAVASSSATPADNTIAQTMQEVSERQAIQQTEIATHEQTKVESDSKFPLRLSGLILLNSFMTTSQVDMSTSPTFALPGDGSTSLSVRQTVLGVEARGPHLLGAASSADVYVDFFGSASASAYGSGSALLRLRTAHASLDWTHAQIAFAQDRTILNPNTPTSLAAVALPALAWSGNLWSWNPQVGLRYDLPARASTGVRLQAAVIDAQDPPGLFFTGTAGAATPGASSSENSRYPGVEARLALLRPGENKGMEFGAGGYFSAHRVPDGTSIHAWAGTLDFRVPLPARLEVTGNVFRGAGLGGLGAGAFKDYVYRLDAPGPHARALDDVGGWAQLKQRVTERVEWNAAAGIDNAFAGQIRPYASTNPYNNLARNLTYTGNVIYSPRAYLLFSFEYRRLASSPVNAPTVPADIYGVAAAYKF